MNKIFLCMVIALGCFAMLCGQSSLGEQLGVLIKQHDKGDLGDTAYLNARNQLVNRFKGVKFDSVIAMQQQTRLLSKKINYTIGEIEAIRTIGNIYENLREYDLALQLYNEATNLAAEKNYKGAESRILNNIGSIHMRRGNYSESYKYLFASLSLAEAKGDSLMVGTVVNNLGSLFFFQQRWEEAETSWKRALNISERLHDTTGLAIAYNNLGELYVEEEMYDMALEYLQTSLKLGEADRNAEVRLATMVTTAKVYEKLDSIEKAIYLYEDALRSAIAMGDVMYEAYAYLGLAQLNFRKGKFNEAKIFAERALAISKNIGQAEITRDTNELLSVLNEKMGNPSAALFHNRQFKLYADSLANVMNERAAAVQQTAYELSRKELQFQRKNMQQRWLTFSAFAGVFSLSIILFVIVRHRNKLNIANLSLKEKNNEIEKQKAKVESALTALESTQSQLIQAEKMASLGELTAGIAHEIQNPLNFVNNFSEVSNELVSELVDEVDKGNTGEVKIIAKDVQKNLEKILHHGKRADAIVKGMLQHSRTSSGQKEPTDINALCDEYLRLALHGLKAKDPSFNASFHFEGDETLPKINVVPQDIGRVLLNLFNNAFQAVAEKQKTVGANFNPDVRVTTKLVFPPAWGLRGAGGARGAEISVKDNGSGISDLIKDKIFQPFFTTKPTGQGTGLGLSLSYDIVKAHGGELKVETMVGEGSEFIIQLPIV